MRLIVVCIEFTKNIEFDENESSFMEQLESGHRELWYKGNKLESNTPCGFKQVSEEF